MRHASRIIASVLATAAFVLALSASAQPTSGKVPRVGFCYGFGKAEHVFNKAFIRGMRDRGWEDGKNVQIFIPEGTTAPDSRVVSSRETYMADKRLDVYVGDRAKDADTQVPRVALTNRVAGTALAMSKTRNTTGITIEDFDSVLAKKMALLKEATGAEHIVRLFWRKPGGGRLKPGLGTEEDMPPDLREAARKLGVTIAPAMFTVHEDLEPTFKAIAARPRTALIFTNSMHWYEIRKNEVGVDQFMDKHRLPTMFAQADWPQTDGTVMIAYGPSFLEMMERLSYFVDRILRGAKPADLPFEQVQHRLAINLDAAKKHGITFPQSIVLQADIVVPHDPPFSWFGELPARRSPR